VNEISESRGGPTVEDEKLRRNERIKLTATWLNSLSVGGILVGGLSPALTGVETGPALAVLRFGLWFVVGGVLHLCASALLGMLRQ
jgi:hypothetical protein